MAPRQVKKLLEVANLRSIETVDSEQLAVRIASAWPGEPLDLSIQVDLSQEETKGGAMWCPRGFTM